MKSEERNTASDEPEDFGVRGLNPEVIERLREAIREAGGNKAVAAKSGVPLSTLNGALHGKNQPRAAAMAAIAAATGRSLDWLMMLSEAPQAQLEEQLQSGGRGRFVDVRRLSFAASAGHGTLIKDSDEKPFPIQAALLDHLGLRPQYTRVLDAHGDSMVPTIQDRDPLIVDISPDARSMIVDNKIYAFSIGEEGFVKRLRREPGRIIMASDNRDSFPEREVPTSEPFRIIGRIRWVGHEL